MESLGIEKNAQFDLVGDNSFSTFLSQYYYSKSTVPRFIYVNEDPDSKQVLKSPWKGLHHIELTLLSYLTESILKENN